MPWVFLYFTGMGEYVKAAEDVCDIGSPRHRNFFNEGYIIYCAESIFRYILPFR